MNAERVLSRIASAVRLRRTAIACAFGFPILAAATVLAWRGLDARAAWVFAGAGLAALAAWIVVRRRAVDPAWLARGLDAHVRAFEDSSALLFSDPATLTALQPLQRERLRARLVAMPEPDLRDTWPARALLVAGALAILVVIAAWRLPAPGPRTGPDGNATAALAARDARIHVTAFNLRIEPPAYTGLPAREQTAPDAKVEEGARLHWRFELDATPTSARIEFHDGTRLALARDGTRWSATRTLERALLYRIVLEGAPALADEGWHTLELVPDRAPEVRVLEPDRTLTLLDGSQRTWALAFEVADDHGVAATTLELTLAQGGGENVTFQQRSIALRGEGEPRALRFRHVLDLAALGIAAGDDVIVRVQVADNRVPEPNLSRSASFILRWPPEAASDGSGVEGLVARALPAYFRSQRQIIIDTEALRDRRKSLREEALLAESNGIAEDQRVLRLRYGQFLGEESSEEESPEGGHDDDHAGPAAGGAPPARFGDPGDAVAAAGHLHDMAEAATLLDTQTRELLRKALDAMWQAERELRQGALDAALPHENRALGFIKQVQQSTRIYLARVGLELPEIDDARRLTGERRGVPPALDLLRDRAVDDTLARFRAALDRGETGDVAALQRWIAAHEAEVPDALGLRAALLRLEERPDCVECRAAVRQRLWPLLQASPPGLVLRPSADDAGRAYLRALAEPPP